MFMDNTEAIIQISATALTFCGVITTAALARKGLKHSKEINAAVNQVGNAGTPRIYDIALASYALCAELKEWKDGFRGSPWQDSLSIDKWIKANSDSMKELCERIGDLEESCPACRIVEQFLEKNKDFRQSSLSPGTGEEAAVRLASSSEQTTNE